MPHEYSQDYWDFLFRLHEIWGMTRKLFEIALILEERQKIKDKKPTYSCLKHCEAGLESTACAGFLYDKETMKLDEEKATNYVYYLKLMNLHRDELREKEKEEVKK